MFYGTQKSQVYFSRDHCCEVIVKNVRKWIFSMCWAFKINNHLSLWNSSAVIRFPGMLPIRNISYLLPMCSNFLRKCINSQQSGQGCCTSLRQIKITPVWFSTPGSITLEQRIICSNVIHCSHRAFQTVRPMVDPGWLLREIWSSRMYYSLIRSSPYQNW